MVPEQSSKIAAPPFTTESGPLSGRQENPMANRAGNTATSTEVIPAGHAALTAKEELGETGPDLATGRAALSLAALGVVFGDIGTSPVYTFRECFNPEHGLPLDAEHVLGVLSMIFWALIIVVTIKYVLLIMRADNQGEGGILALLALALEAARGERSRTRCRLGRHRSHGVSAGLLSVRSFGFATGGDGCQQRGPRCAKCAMCFV